MANLMVGRELSDLYPPQATPSPPTRAPRCACSGLTVPGWAQDVGFEVRPGEILGFAGLVGAGRTELFEGLLGLRPRSAAAVEIWTAAPVPASRSPREAARHGLTYLSEDRKGKGLHVDFGLRAEPDADGAGALRRALAAAATPSARRWPRRSTDFGIRTGVARHARPRRCRAATSRSWRWPRCCSPSPKVVVLDEPTRGVDVGAKRDIYFLIQRLAREGLRRDRDLVRADGADRPVPPRRRDARRPAGQATLDADQLTEEELIAHATGTH